MLSVSFFLIHTNSCNFSRGVKSWRSVPGAMRFLHPSDGFEACPPRFFSNLSANSSDSIPHLRDQRSRFYTGRLLGRRSSFTSRENPNTHDSPGSGDLWIHTDCLHGTFSCYHRLVLLPRSRHSYQSGYGQCVLRQSL